MKPLPRFSRRSFLAATGAVAAGFRLPAFATEEKKLNFYN